MEQTFQSTVPQKTKKSQDPPDTSSLHQFLHVKASLDLDMQNEDKIFAELPVMLELNLIIVFTGEP